MSSDPFTIKSTSHLITIPFPPSPFFLIQILHLKDSLSINVFQSPNPAHLPPSLTSSKISSTTQDQIQDQEVDELDLELSKALKESGRIDSSNQNQNANTNGDGHSLSQVQDFLPLARISREWSVAMNTQIQNPSSQQSPTTTSIFRTPSDLSRSMSSRFSKKFTKSQIFLSLDLPESLLPNAHSQMSGKGVGSMEQSKGLLLLEKGISRAVEMGILEVEGK